VKDCTCGFCPQPLHDDPFNEFVSGFISVIFQGVRHLVLAGGALDDAALAEGLGRLPALRTLHCRELARVQGHGLAVLRTCPRVQHVGVRECAAVADAGLFHLARGALRSLISLEVKDISCGCI